MADNPASVPCRVKTQMGRDLPRAQVVMQGGFYNIGLISETTFAESLRGSENASSLRPARNS